MLPWEKGQVFLLPGGCGQKQDLEERQAGGGGEFASVALQIRAKEKMPPVRTAGLEAELRGHEGRVSVNTPAGAHALPAGEQAPTRSRRKEKNLLQGGMLIWHQVTVPPASSRTPVPNFPAARFFPLARRLKTDTRRTTL